jgi:hypothetical protein
MDDGRVLAVLVVREVAGGLEEVELADVGGEDLVVSLAGGVLADEALQLIGDDGALGLPEDQALGDLLVEAPAEEESVATCELDLAEVSLARRKRPCLRDTRMVPPPVEDPAQVPWPTSPEELAREEQDEA